MGMCVGEKRKLTIPSGLGYGETGAGADIKGGDTLVFEVEVRPSKERRTISRCSLLLVAMPFAAITNTASPPLTAA